MPAWVLLPLRDDTDVFSGIYILRTNIMIYLGHEKKSACISMIFTYGYQLFLLLFVFLQILITLGRSDDCKHKNKWGWP